MGKVVVIVGATAVGKTAVSARLADVIDGEIVNADASSFYRGMTVGTAKPTLEERSRVRHHLIDIAAPDETVSVGEYQQMVYAVFDEILARGKVPLLVGGSGLYIRAVVEGYLIPEVPPQEAFRAEMEAFVERAGKEALFARLEAVDPTAAARIDYRNARRVIRALEIYAVTGQTEAERNLKQDLPYEFVMVGLARPREEIYARVDARIERMLAGGLVAEVEALQAAGYDFSLPALSAIGYRQVARMLAGEMDEEEVVAEMGKFTRRLVRQQSNWFIKRDKERTVWFDLGEEGVYEKIEEYVQGWLG
ncbi:MAG TPA: tRNA (adenosine(37)-N6)-dimethylallyltransferase MiaA [Anaerolineae bacterium]|nr:tRNA (adenosine(37)-N6)-dimethylallyltransferase MiaA [Anaerolineae bacterium]